MELPYKINICGIIYSVEYKENPSDVDIHRRESLWGQIDYWTRTIRIYHNNNPLEDVWQTIIHEVVHGICNHLALNEFDKPENHDDLDVLALGLFDTFARNGWLKI